MKRKKTEATCNAAMAALSAIEALQVIAELLDSPVASEANRKFALERVPLEVQNLIAATRDIGRLHTDEIAITLAETHDDMVEVDGCWGQSAVGIVEELAGWRCKLIARTVSGSDLTQAKPPVMSLKKLRSEVRDILAVVKKLSAVNVPKLVEMVEKEYQQAAKSNAKDPIVLTPIQKAILKALDGRAMTKQQLANAVCDGEGTRLYRPGALPELRDRQLVQHKRQVGYFRPDAPPSKDVN